METAFRMVFGAGAMVAAVFALLGIWLPRFRPQWGRTNVTIGTLASIGVGLFAMSMGSIALWLESLSERHRLWFVALAVIGWTTSSAGYALDVRSFSRRSNSSPVPNPKTSRAPDERDGWWLVACGVAFLIMLLWFFGRSK
jgi:hypothetical protein